MKNKLKFDNKKEWPKEKFDLEIEIFLNNIESLRTTLPDISKILQDQTFERNTEYQDFLDNDCELEVFKLLFEALYLESPLAHNFTHLLATAVAPILIA